MRPRLYIACLWSTSHWAKVTAFLSLPNLSKIHVETESEEPNWSSSFFGKTYMKTNKDNSEVKIQFFSIIIWIKMRKSKSLINFIACFKILLQILIFFWALQVYNFSSCNNQYYVPACSAINLKFPLTGLIGQNRQSSQAITCVVNLMRMSVVDTEILNRSGASMFFKWFEHSLIFNWLSKM